MLSTIELTQSPLPLPSLQARTANDSCNSTDETAHHDTPPGTCHAASSTFRQTTSPSDELNERLLHGPLPATHTTTPNEAAITEQQAGGQSDIISSAFTPGSIPSSVDQTAVLQNDTDSTAIATHNVRLNGVATETPTVEQHAAATKIQAAIRGTRRDILSGPILTSLQGSNTAPSEEALVLLTEHWLEMSDKKHRYGSNLKPYHERWLQDATNEDFFEWLDKGSGKDLSLEERPRERLESELVQYLQEHERERYAVTAKDGLLYYRESGDLVHTLPDSVRAEDEVDLSQVLPDADANDDEATRLEKKRLRNRAKYIYVMGPKGVLYIGRKIKGKFHHSSFFGGGTVSAAGGIVVNHGRLIKVNPKSGHYRPGQTHFDRLLRTLHEMGIPMDNVKISTSIFDRSDRLADG
ncbi:hypothetical protein BGZ73_007546 [Actinomortierella ambigua]|nr:hypothetical protein BGZ73_007546 [Actinomortierella ambigua]